jgi:very-short-patch-repair endonuclease
MIRLWWDIIDEANEIHDWKYDYSEFEYKNADHKSTIICPLHIPFQQDIYHHINRKQGCSLCSKRPRITTEYFKIIAKEIHGDRYIYDKVKYVNQCTKVIIGCHKHGDFLQSPVNHTNKARGCAKCNGGVKLSREDVLIKANEVHNFRYTYEDFVFVNYHAPSWITCKEHGNFKQHFNNHINSGKGCPECANIINADRQRMPLEEFIKRANEVHNNKYDYSKFKYINNQTKSTIICPDHGPFYQQPNNHIGGARCYICSGITYRSLEEAIIRANEVHNNLYTYDNYEYVNSQTPSWITCNKHGDFQCHMGNHINLKRGCPMCRHKTEGILHQILKDNFDYKVIHNRGFDWCKNKNKLRYDFIIEELKCIIELDGGQHFEQVMNWDSPQNQLENDIFKNKKAIENGYSMIRVYQPDIFKRDPETILKLIMSIQRYEKPQLICIGEIYTNRF